MSDTTSDHAVLLRALDFAAAEFDSSIYEEAASAIRALEETANALRRERREFSDWQRSTAAERDRLEAKVREAEHWNEVCEAENRKHILSLREHAQRLEGDRDRLAAEVAALRADAERYRWLRAHMTWYVDYEADGDAFVPFHRWYWNASPVVLELDAAIDAARGAGEGE